MIVPGLDRLDGTSVNAGMDDQVWHEHTLEILEAFHDHLDQVAKAAASGEEALTMLEFCRDYAEGKKFTKAMRKLQSAVTFDFKPDIAAQRMVGSTGREWPRPDSLGLILGKLL